MAVFRYRARTPRGDEVSGQLEAPDEAAAREQLQRRELSIEELVLVEAPTVAIEAELAEPPSRLSAAEAEEVARQVSHLAASGLPLVTGLRAAADECPNGRVRRALRTVARNLADGQSIESALGEANSWFPRHVQGLIVAAIRTGRFAEALSELTDHQLLAARLRRMLIGALAYPLVVTFLAVVIILTILAVLVPGFRSMMEEFQLDLPFLPRLLFWWYDVGITICLAALLAVLVLGGLYRLIAGRMRWSRLLASVPLVGRLRYWSAVAEWAGLMALLVRYEVPLPESLRLAAAGIKDAFVGSQSTKLAEGVSRGRPLSQLVAEGNSIPASVAPLLQWGEENNGLAEAFRSTQTIFQERAEMRAVLLKMLLPPMLFVAIACSVIFVVTALFTPLVSLVSSLS